VQDWLYLFQNLCFIFAHNWALRLFPVWDVENFSGINQVRVANLRIGCFKFRQTDAKAASDGVHTVTWLHCVAIRSNWRCGTRRSGRLRWGRRLFSTTVSSERCCVAIKDVQVHVANNTINSATTRILPDRPEGPPVAMRSAMW